MKVKIFGFFLMVVGFITLAIGVGFISSATQEGVQNEDVKVSIKTGAYYLKGDKSADCISLNGDGTLSLNGSENIKYEVKIWYDMPITDEKTGKITLSDKYFLEVKPGDEKEAVKVQYDYANNTLIYNGSIYIK